MMTRTQTPLPDERKQSTMATAEEERRRSLWQRVAAAMGWTRSSYVVMSVFLATLFVIGVVWWPLLEEGLSYFDPERPWWIQVDWLLMGNFATMSLLIMAGADLKRDVLVVLVGLAGGLVIEGWGTQTELWTYYTRERPPFWIIPAWPIASLSIDRLVRLLDRRLPPLLHETIVAAYWTLFPAFYALMLAFVWPTLDKSLTVLALIACILLIGTPTDHRLAVLTFVAGTGLGYFLERWGTTRRCWIYYTRQTPPLFAVLAHGLAAVAFWRVGLLIKRIGGRLLGKQERAPHAKDTRPRSPHHIDKAYSSGAGVASGDSPGDSPGTIPSSTSCRKSSRPRSTSGWAL